MDISSNYRNLQHSFPEIFGSQLRRFLEFHRRSRQCQISTSCFRSSSDSQACFITGRNVSPDHDPDEDRLHRLELPFPREGARIRSSRIPHGVPQAPELPYRRRGRHRHPGWGGQRAARGRARADLREEVQGRVRGGCDVVRFAPRGLQRHHRQGHAGRGPHIGEHMGPQQGDGHVRGDVRPCADRFCERSSGSRPGIDSQRGGQAVREHVEHDLLPAVPGLVCHPVHDDGIRGHPHHRDARGRIGDQARGYGSCEDLRRGDADEPCCSEPKSPGSKGIVRNTVTIPVSPGSCRPRRACSCAGPWSLSVCLWIPTRSRSSRRMSR